MEKKTKVTSVDHSGTDVNSMRHMENGNQVSVDNAGPNTKVLSFVEKCQETAVYNQILNDIMQLG